MRGSGSGGGIASRVSWIRSGHVSHVLRALVLLCASPTTSSPTTWRVGRVRRTLQIPLVVNLINNTIVSMIRRLVRVAVRRLICHSGRRPDDCRASPRVPYRCVPLSIRSPLALSAGHTAELLASRRGLNCPTGHGTAGTGCRSVSFRFCTTMCSAEPCLQYRGDQSGLRSPAVNRGTGSCAESGSDGRLHHGATIGISASAVTLRFES